MLNIQTKRIYEQAAKEDGMRILIDRIWPRGVSREKARIDHWAKDLAPSQELRKWYGHEHGKWDEFKSRYHAELDENSEGFAEIVNLIKGEKVTLVFSSRETRLNNACAFKLYMEKQLG